MKNARERRKFMKMALAFQFRARRGFGTLEIVIIIAVLLTIALIFRQSILTFANRLIDTVFKNDSVITDLTINSAK
jgi:hypothetical protein